MLKLLLLAYSYHHAWGKDECVPQHEQVVPMNYLMLESLTVLLQVPCQLLDATLEALPFFFSWRL